MKVQDQLFFLIRIIGLGLSNFLIKLSLILFPVQASVGHDRSNNGKQKTDIDYNCYKQNRHVIHVLTVNPKQFNLELVKSHNQVIGRERLNTIGLRKNAIAAINAGFFEIGNNDDGRPSLTLMINGKLFGLRKQLQALLILDQNNIQISQGKATIFVEINNISITPHQINHFSSPQNITLYNDTCGPTSLSPYNNKEIIIDHNFIVMKVSDHGDNHIPSQGLIVSFPANMEFPLVKEGDRVNLHLAFTDKNNDPIKLSKFVSIVTGIPILIQNGKIFKEWPNGTGITEAHARTAIGIRSDGTVVMVVVEHLYKQSIKDLKLNQIRSMLRKDKNLAIETLTIAEVLKLLDKEFSNQEVIGFTIEELAKYMLDLGCVEAINLDGGGSSTLFMNGKIVNNITGDKDEALGEKVVRPIADAIIVTRPIN